MPFTKLTLKEASSFLNIPQEDLKYLIQKGKIPFIKERGSIFLKKHCLKEWASQRILNEDLVKLKKNSFMATHIWSRPHGKPAQLSEYLDISTIHADLPAKTKPSLLKELVQLALKSCLVNDSDLLLKLLKEREEQESTGLKNGVAIPHPQIHPPELFSNSFIAVAKLASGIPFGAADHLPSFLFFMPCAVNEEEHLFMLSRLTSLIKRTLLIKRLLNSSEANEILEIFREEEKKLLNF